jgi:3-phosphoshikimate 1-carboxyvinyltransferase
MGCPLERKEEEGGAHAVTLPERSELIPLRPLRGEVPGDLSAAAFFVVAATIIPGSEVVLRGVGVNPTRTGVLDILVRMGAKIEPVNPRIVGGEEVCDLKVTAAPLRGTVVTPAEVVLAIDEIPVLAIAAALSQGQTEIRGAEELRVKESDRLKMVALLLRDFGVVVEELPDGLIVQGRGGPAGITVGFLQHGGPSERPAVWERSGDHRISMCGAILEGASTGAFSLHDLAAVETSFPTFIECFRALLAPAAL